METTLYYLSSNDSFRKVKAYLNENGVSFTTHPMITNPLTKEQLFEILKYTENGVEDILSTRSKDYLNLIEQGIDFEEVSLTELHELVEKHPKLLRSPITMGKGIAMIGYVEDEITTLMDRKVRKESYLRVLNIVRAEENRNIAKLKITKHDRVIAV